MLKTQWINSQIYHELLVRANHLDSYGAIAVYATLLKSRNTYHYIAPIKNSNNKTTVGYRLLSKQSGLSLTSLKKYVPILMEIGLCDFTVDGGFFLAGKREAMRIGFSLKNKENVTFKIKDKKVPIRIGGNLAETKLFAKAVMICSNINGQKKRIDVKVTLRELKRLADQNQVYKKSQLKTLKTTTYMDFVEGGAKVVKNTLLSNVGVAAVIEGKYEQGIDQNQRQRGKYVMDLLIEKGLVMKRRRFATVASNQVSRSEFLASRDTMRRNSGMNITYKNCRISTEIVPEVYWADNYNLGTTEQGDIAMPYNSPQMKERVLYKYKNKPNTINKELYNTQYSKYNKVYGNSNKELIVEELRMNSNR